MQFTVAISLLLSAGIAAAAPSAYQQGTQSVSRDAAPQQAPEASATPSSSVCSSSQTLACCNAGEGNCSPLANTDVAQCQGGDNSVMCCNSNNSGDTETVGLINLSTSTCGAADPAALAGLLDGVTGLLDGLLGAL